MVPSKIDSPIWGMITSVGMKPLLERSPGRKLPFLSLVNGDFLMMKKPLECALSVYANSETTIAAGNAVKGCSRRIINR